MSYPFSINSVLVRSDGHSFTFRKLLAFCRPKNMSVIHKPCFDRLKCKKVVKQSLVMYPSLPKEASTELPTCGCLEPKGSTDKPNVWTALVIQPSMTILPSASKCLRCDGSVLSQLAVAKPWDITL